MPVDMKRYPKEWPEISAHVKKLANYKCERCGAEHGKPHPLTGSKVILTVAHVGPNKHDKMDCSQLEALCQRCHIREDIEEHLANSRRTRWRRKRAAMLARGQLELIPVEEG